MLACFYLLLCVLTGFCIVELLFKNFGALTKSTFFGNKINLSSLYLRLPAYFSVGVLLLTWILYILCCIFRKTSNPVGTANAIVMSMAAVFVVIGMFLIVKRRGNVLKGEAAKISTGEIVMITMICLLVFFLMFKTLGMIDGKLKIGLSVFSDFSTHLSMMRSFSKGMNFPTEYTFFGGEDVKYHFMFQFLCGNLEFLGLRLDQALNIPSILSMIFSYFMLFVLAVKLSGRKSVGYFTLLFYTFRSSNSLFEYILELPKGEVWNRLKETTEFIGSTENENWGLWNLNVYCNQRHFSFSLTIMLLVLVLVLPAFFEGCGRLAESLKRLKAEKEAAKQKPGINYLKFFISESLINKSGWKIKDYKTAIFTGLLLGASGFFNGAVLIGTVIVLFFVAAGSDRRLEYVIVAGIAGVLSLIQSKVFISSQLFQPQYYYGFLSNPKNFFGSVDYVWKLMGLLTVVLLIQFLLSKGTAKYLMACFSMPIIFAFTVSLTPDISVNHKYVMMAIMLLDIFAAIFVVGIFKKKDIWFSIVGVILCLCMTLTGFFELYIVGKKNADERAMLYPYSDEIMEWIWDNTDSSSLFLSANYYLMYSGYGNSVILSGRKMYSGWDYFSWSAGYDVGARNMVVQDVYSCDDRDKLYKLIENTDIDYIVVDRVNRGADTYDLNEKTIASAYERVFTTGSGIDRFSIYDVSKKVSGDIDFDSMDIYEEPRALEWEDLYPGDYDYDYDFEDDYDYDDEYEYVDDYPVEYVDEYPAEYDLENDYERK